MSESNYQSSNDMAGVVFQEALKKYLPPRDYNDALGKLKSSQKVFFDELLVATPNYQQDGGLLSETQYPDFPIFHNPSVIIDLANQVNHHPSNSNNPEALVLFKDSKQKAEKDVTEQQLMDRYNEYQLTATEILGSQSVIESTVKDISNTISDSNLLSSIFNKVKKTIINSFTRLKYYLIGVKEEISLKIDEIMGLLGRKLNDVMNEFREKISDLVNSLAKYFSTVIVKMIDWISTIEDIARKKGFAMKSLKISIEPVGVKTVPVVGFPIPFVEFKMPKIDFEFALGESSS